jgi:hypothetical protein
MTPQQIEKFKNTFILNPVMSKSIINFITTLLEKQREEYVEMIRGYKFSSWNGEEEVEKGIEEIISLIKSHDKTS